MKNINDYKGTKTAIHCKTQEEWDWVVKNLFKDEKGSSWSKYKENSCIDVVGDYYASLYYNQNIGFTVIPASDFINNKNTTMTKVTIIGQEPKEEKKLKPIEFLKCVGENETDSVLCEPNEFKYIELVSTKYLGCYDMLYARNTEERTAGVYYLGHFNDGIVE